MPIMHSNCKTEATSLSSRVGAPVGKGDAVFPQISAVLDVGRRADGELLVAACGQGGYTVTTTSARRRARVAAWLRCVKRHRRTTFFTPYNDTGNKGLTLNFKKCKWTQNQVRFCGKTVGSGKIFADPEKPAVTEKLCPPKSKTELRRVLGFFWFLPRSHP